METRILTFSGGPRKTFDEAFWPGVTRVSPEGYPLQGSVGAAWEPHEDLKAIGSLEDLKGVKREGGLSAQALSQLRAFLAFCDSDDGTPFFLRRGTQLLWLVRKVGGYFYEASTDNPDWGCHRVAFEFVRSATAEEAAPNKALGFRTLAWITVPADAVAPEPKFTPPFRAEEEMLTNGKVKAKRASKKAAGGAGAGTGTVAGTVQTLEQVMERAGKPLEVAPAIGVVAGASTGTGAGASTGATEAPLTTYVKPVPAPLRPALLEAPEAPLSVERVEVVKVRLFEHGGTTYYREPIKNKLYKRQTNGSIGPYLGRWNPRLKTVDLTLPDTDAEHD